MTIAERNNKLKHLITCMKCEVSGKECDDNCPTQYNAGNMGEIIENLEAISKALEQESRKGHWFIDERPESNRETICSNCEQPIFKYHKLDFDYRPSFCPNCGADMREVKE